MNELNKIRHMHIYRCNTQHSSHQYMNTKTHMVAGVCTYTPTPNNQNGTKHINPLLSCPHRLPAEALTLSWM